jgi:hypothetical protein
MKRWDVGGPKIMGYQRTHKMDVGGPRKWEMEEQQMECQSSNDTGRWTFSSQAETL